MSSKSPRKPPKPFRKPLKEKKYRKKLAGRIYLEPDREFLEAITARDENGRVILARELGKDEATRLKKLRKVARKNRAGLRTARLAILAVIAGAVVIFNLVFKDQLVTNAAESTLEEVFNARAEIDGLRFRPLKGAIEFTSLVIADSEAPMQNLFEVSGGVLQVNSWQLVNGHVLIDEVRADSLSFGTPRETSGELPADVKPEETDSAAASGPGTGRLADRVAEALPELSLSDLGLPDTLDARKFIEENLDALSTPVLVDELASSATSFVDRWTGQINTLADELLDVADDVADVARTDFTSVRSVDAAMAVYNDATAVAANVTGMSDRIEAQYNALVSEATGILEAARELPGKAADDYESLVARIPDVRAGGREFIVGIVEPYVREALGVWYDRLFRVSDIYHRITAGTEEREPGRGRRTGTNVEFPGTSYPRFLLSAASLGVAPADGRTLEAGIRHLTSDPDLVGAATAIDYSQAGGAGALAVDVTLDGRAGTEVPFQAAVSLDDAPLAVSRGLELLDLTSVTGTLGLSAAVQRRPDGVVDGTLSLSATGLEVAGAYSSDSLGEFVAELFNSARALDGRFSFAIEDRSNIRFLSGETNLDDLVADAVRERIDSAVAAFRVELEERVTAYLDPMIDSLAERLDGIVSVETSAAELLSLARDREAAAAELEKLARDSIANIRDQLEAEARAALDAAKAEAEARARAVIDAAEEEARRAAEEAEAAARAAAEEAAAEAEQAARDAAGEAAGDAVEDAVDSIRDAIPTLPRRR